MSTTRHGSGTQRTGSVYYANAGASRGVAIPPLYVHEFGAVEVLDADGICVAATATGAKNLSATGALVSSSVATLTTPRGIRITSTGIETATFTVAGTDVYGETMSEAITATTGAAVNGAKAFKTVTSVAVSGALVTTGGVNVGTNDVLGLPFRLADVGKMVAFSADGKSDASVTIVAGLSTTAVSSTTSADVRGTVDPNSAANGSIRFTSAFVLADTTSKEKTYGVSQA